MGKVSILLTPVLLLLVGQVTLLLGPESGGQDTGRDPTRVMDLKYVSESSVLKEEEVDVFFFSFYSPSPLKRRVENQYLEEDPGSSASRDST